MSSTRATKVRNAVYFLISALLVGVAILLLLNRQYVLDQLSVWNYQPTEGIETIDQRVAFTEQGRFVFFATQPELENQEEFNRSCPRQEAGSPILGCYTSDDRIYIYDVTSDQMNGIEEVTAVHEMLHAAWYRLSSSEQTRLSVELKNAYDSVDNPSLKKRMDYYQRTEPGEFINELHSILGTEVSPLSQSLEAYYEQYFDRSAVIALHQQYSDKYLALHERADDLHGKMQSLSTTIATKAEAYEASSTQLRADIDSFNRRASRGEFSSYAQFYAERATLMNRSSALEADRQAINAHIATYNTYYNEYQEIAQQIDVLNDSIDSYKQLDKAPSV